MTVSLFVPCRNMTRRHRDFLWLLCATIVFMLYRAVTQAKQKIENSMHTTSWVSTSAQMSGFLAILFLRALRMGTEQSILDGWRRYNVLWRSCKGLSC